jgi:hypothetical protein
MASLSIAELLCLVNDGETVRSRPVHYIRVNHANGAQTGATAQYQESAIGKTGALILPIRSPAKEKG